MNGWAVAFWLVVVVATAALAVEDRRRRDHLHQKIFLQRWIRDHSDTNTTSPYEQERRRRL